MWLLEWFDPRTQRRLGAVALATLDDAAACELLDLEPTDPIAWMGRFTVGPGLAPRVQGHTNHTIEVDRHDYELRRLSERAAAEVLGDMGG